MADRGYESYNIFAHAEKKGWNYLIGVKDKGSRGMVSGYQLPKQETFDISVSTVLTRKQTNEVKKNPLKYKLYQRPLLLIILIYIKIVFIQSHFGLFDLRYLKIVMNVLSRI